MSRKALMIGIDDYEGCKLSACVNDAKALGEALEYNYDDTKNFDVSFLLDAEATRARVRKSIKNLFKETMTLLYYISQGMELMMKMMVLLLLMILHKTIGVSQCLKY